MTEHELIASADAKPESMEDLLAAHSRRLTYVKPRLIVIATADELLEALGPAQANYNGTGLP